MSLVENWRDVLTKAWSVRLIALAAILSGIEAVLPMFETSFPKGVFAAASGFVTAGALLARVIAQKDIGDGEQ